MWEEPPVHDCSSGSSINGVCETGLWGEGIRKMLPPVKNQVVYFSSVQSQILPLFILKENFDSSNPEMTRWEEQGRRA